MSTWRVEVEFRSLFDGEKPYTFEHGTHWDAYLQGRFLSCTRGCVRVTVAAPDGSIAHEYARADNIWRDRIIATPPVEDRR